MFVKKPIRGEKGIKKGAIARIGEQSPGERVDFRWRTAQPPISASYSSAMSQS